MSWSLREKLRRDFVAMLPSRCQVTSAYVRPRQIFNNRTVSLAVKQSRWLRVRDFVFTFVVVAAVNVFSENVFGQDGLVPLRMLTPGESSSAQPTSLAAEFADRLEKNQIEIEKTIQRRLRSN